MKVDIHDAAGDEAAELVRWYKGQNPRAAERLAELFVATVVQIARQPLSFSPMEGPPTSKDVRRARIRGFPIIVIFQIRPDEAFVVAVAHAAREPGYWTSRLA